MDNEVRKGEEVEVRIDRLAFGGAGVGRLNGLVTFVPFTAPGDVVRARIIKRKKSHAEAQVVQIVAPSPDRVTPPCPYFGVCGGCAWQHISYARQLEAKQSLVQEAIEHIASLRGVAVSPILPSPVQYRHRNKMDLTFGLTPDGAPALGFHRPDNFRHVLDIETCRIQPEAMDRIVAVCREFIRQRDLSCYDPVRHTGLMRHLMMRHSVATGSLLVVVTSATPPAEATPEYAELARRLREAVPEARGFVWGANDKPADVMNVERVLYREGEDRIEERLGSTRFRISARSFFQTNTRATQVLYDAIADGLELDGSKTVLDAYCGTGSIGLYCARRAGAVWGLELITEAVWDARANAALNGLENCRFIAGDIRQTLRLAVEGLHGRPDCVIVDPPRGGMHKKALAGLLELEAPALIYVSCNPTTLARDLTDILGKGYRLARIQPVDLFPQTYHVETVCRFEK